ncbi:unnamed protein product [Spirodela intermedia]|uniref:Uncharacterized protein n=1 Tax=Spirodela intermedia TaxID=51605 RepID=A0A7I8KXM1_SPIIN|nr:unnamed protein product [Spirodela intermedia]
MERGRGQVAAAIFFFFFFVVVVIVVDSAGVLAAGSPKLARYEVNALQQIAKSLKKTKWDFGVDPCSGRGNWNVSSSLKRIESSVICDCSSNSSACHVITMYPLSLSHTHTHILSHDGLRAWILPGEFLKPPFQ